MPTITSTDNVEIFYVEAGSGTPIIFIHEFGGDLRSYEAQLRHFSRRYRCIAFNARGFPPSTVPDSLDLYSQERSFQDVLALMTGLSITRAHFVGASMGSFTALKLAMLYPERAISITLLGCGYGADPKTSAKFRDQVVRGALMIETSGMEAFAGAYAYAPSRVQLENKDPRGHLEFKSQLAGRDPIGSALTMRGVQLGRQPFDEDFGATLNVIKVPTLIVTGDEDDATLEPSIFLKRSIPSADLAIIPGAGHTLHLEEPAELNRLLDNFFHQISVGRHALRDPRASNGQMLGQGA